jgi:hypothetical protein
MPGDRLRQTRPSGASPRKRDGDRGYRPVLVLWAERDLMVADELRDCKALLEAHWIKRPRSYCPKRVLKGIHRWDLRSCRRLAANPRLPQTPRSSGGFEGRAAISGTPNLKFKSVANLPLWLKRHTLLKNLKVDVASIDSKPSPDSI